MTAARSICLEAGRVRDGKCCLLGITSRKRRERNNIGKVIKAGIHDATSVAGFPFPPFYKHRVQIFRCSTEHDEIPSGVTDDCSMKDKKN